MAEDSKKEGSEAPSAGNGIPKRKFAYDNREFSIDNSGKIRTFADFDERTGTVLIDSGVPEKFFEGLAVHEIEERKLIKKGHSYQYSHNEAQKKELEFYEQKYGKEEGMKILEEEEALVFRPVRRKVMNAEEAKADTESIPLQPTDVQTIWLRAIVFQGRTYIVDNSKKLIGTVVDICERGDMPVIYIDSSVPEKFFGGMIVFEIEQRRLLKQGSSYTASRDEAIKFELAYYEKKLGDKETAAKTMEEEYKLYTEKFDEQRKALKNNEHKVIYERGEIVPK